MLMQWQLAMKKLLWSEILSTFSPLPWCKEVCSSKGSSLSLVLTYSSVVFSFFLSCSLSFSFFLILVANHSRYNHHLLSQRQTVCNFNIFGILQDRKNMGFPCKVFKRDSHKQNIANFEKGWLWYGQLLKVFKIYFDDKKILESISFSDLLWI